MRVRIIKSRSGEHLGEEGFVEQADAYCSPVFVRDSKEIYAQNIASLSHIHYLFDYVYEEIDDNLACFFDIDL